MVLVPERSLGVVVLMNAGDAANPRRVYDLSDWAIALALGQEPPPNPPAFAAWPQVVVAVVDLALVGWMLWSVRGIRRGRASATPSPSGASGWFLPIAAPLVLHLAATGIFAFVIPGALGGTVGLARLWVPDLGYLLTLGSLFALGWGALRTILVLSFAWSGASHAAVAAIRATSNQPPAPSFG